MCICWGSLLHNGEYLVIEQLAIEDVFGTGRVIINSDSLSNASRTRLQAVGDRAVRWQHG